MGNVRLGEDYKVIDERFQLSRHDWLVTFVACVLMPAGENSNPTAFSMFNLRSLSLKGTCFSVETYKRDFIDFMVRANVLTFGDFTTKSGRKTPFFINTGRYRTGEQMNRLAGFYADAILARGIEFDFLFGPAYKGIPLATAISMELSRRGKDVPFCFNRKEAKDHGEGGSLVGHKPEAGQRVLIVEDVTTAGTSIRETVPVLKAAADVQIAGLVVSVNRMERGQGDLNALTELRQEFGMDTFAIVNVEEVANDLKGREVDGNVVVTDELFDQIQAYRKQYGGVE